jgi:hypothetical protein
LFSIKFLNFIITKYFANGRKLKFQCLKKRLFYQLELTIPCRKNHKSVNKNEPLWMVVPAGSCLGGGRLAGLWQRRSADSALGGGNAGQSSVAARPRGSGRRVMPQLLLKFNFNLFISPITSYYTKNTKKVHNV